MQSKKYNWLYVIVAGLVSLAVLFGGQMLFNKYAMARPMDKMLEQIDGIESLKIDFHETFSDGELGKIHVKLNNVKNLQELYNQMTAVLNKYGGAKKYGIVLTDNRDNRLKEFYYRIHYYLEEARDKSNFAAMDEKIRQEAGASGINAKVYIDADYIYIQLSEMTGENEEKLGGDGLNQGNLEESHTDRQMYVVLPRKRASY